MQVEDKDKIARLANVIGKVIKKHRLEKNKTMYKISAECSIHKSSWRLIEQGLVQDIKISTLWKISEGLDVPLITILKEVNAELGDKFSLTDLK